MGLATTGSVSCGSSLVNTEFTKTKEMVFQQNNSHQHKKVLCILNPNNPVEAVIWKRLDHPFLLNTDLIGFACASLLNTV